MTESKKDIAFQIFGERKKQKQIENAFEWIEENYSKTIYTIETTWCWIYIRELRRLCE